MAYLKVEITSSEWTLIGDNVSEITFQNATTWPIYLNFTAANTAPSDNVGLIYGGYEGELKKTVSELTIASNPSYVWAKSTGSSGKIIIEE